MFNVRSNTIELTIPFIEYIFPSIIPLVQDKGKGKEIDHRWSGTTASASNAKEHPSSSQYTEHTSLQRAPVPCHSCLGSNDCMVRTDWKLGQPYAQCTSCTFSGKYCSFLDGNIGLKKEQPEMTDTLTKKMEKNQSTMCTIIEQIAKSDQETGQLRSELAELTNTLVAQRADRKVELQIQIQNLRLVRAIGQYIHDVHHSNKDYRPPLPDNFGDLFVAAFPPETIGVFTSLNDTATHYQ